MRINYFQPYKCELLGAVEGSICIYRWAFLPASSHDTGLSLMRQKHCVCVRGKYMRHNDHQKHSAGSWTEVSTTDGLSQEGMLISIYMKITAWFKIVDYACRRTYSRSLTLILYVLLGVLWVSCNLSNIFSVAPKRSVFNRSSKEQWFPDNSRLNKMLQNAIKKINIPCFSFACKSNSSIQKFSMISHVQCAPYLSGTPRVTICCVATFSQ